MDNDEKLHLLLIDCTDRIVDALELLTAATLSSEMWNDTRNNSASRLDSLKRSLDAEREMMSKDGVMNERSTSFKLEMHDDRPWLPYLQKRAVHGQLVTSDGNHVHHQVQIRVEDDEGNVYMSVMPTEQSDWWSLQLPWKEFAEMMMQAAKEHPKAKRFER